MSSHQEQRTRMVERHLRSRGITNPDILAAMGEVPREDFVPEEMREFAYEDGPLPIGEGQTISQPYIVALMIDAADVAPGGRVLEVGAGSGYAAAVMSRIAGEVFSIERHEPLAKAAAERIDRLGYDNVSIIAGDGTKGMPDEAPFDAILVAAGGDKVPEPLKRQLAVGGRLVVPVGGEDVQTLLCITRTGENDWSEHDLGGVRFVPLIGAFGRYENGSRAATNHQPARELSLPECIAEAAEPLPDLISEDFAAAFDRFADRRVVLLGEASHGTHEFYAARAAITKRFVERHGFTIVAAEADWPDAAVLDRHIRHQHPREGAPRPFERFPTWMWRNPVIARLMHDLHALNRGRDPKDMAGFYGLDIYNMSSSIEAVLAYLDEHDPQAAAVARERYGCLTPWQAEPSTYGRAALSRGYAECEQQVIAECRDLLERALEGDGGMFGAAMNARLVASAERYYRIMYYGGAESWNLRDSHMADTLDHLLEHRGPDSKALVWAHNSHIGDASATEMGRVRGEHNIGQLVRERWGDQAALIGFGTHTGTVTAATDWDGDHETKRVLPSRSDSYERACHDSGVERFLLDLTPGLHEGLRRRLAEPRLERFIGVIYRPETERWSHYSEAILSEQFEAFVWFDETTALRPLTAHEPHEGVPDTFPFGI
ncbi:protein-L-isoaspartate(D-aspartate) O-methyltransferase [Altererythrobacter soli]|uniref:Protein-L-isoaspartate O-methyltransferase n=1 Tax=Croceibacterium soli TaxID=1739690 RepID=A0A6I4US27_9SPHN|nr:protein-L-isoaspartate(D-aspartate) O-methyltransferase [Croceibacterium soli]MXP40449.1 protein-L-isoaspartate(D-aspartate) O-methyltransferase [Croceibacterium soli]